MDRTNEQQRTYDEQKNREYVDRKKRKEQSQNETREQSSLGNSADQINQNARKGDREQNWIFLLQFNNKPVNTQFFY